MTERTEERVQMFEAAIEELEASNVVLGKAISALDDESASSGIVPVEPDEAAEELDIGTLMAQYGASLETVISTMQAVLVEDTAESDAAESDESLAQTQTSIGSGSTQSPASSATTPCSHTPKATKPLHSLEALEDTDQ
jgi:hypothetical protein